MTEATAENPPVNQPGPYPGTKAAAKVLRLVDLNPAGFAHPYDRQTIQALARIRGFDTAVSKLIEWQHERGAHVVHSSSSLRVTARQLPGLHQLLLEGCRVLDLEPPELYVARGVDGMNAYTSGNNNPYIVLTTDLVETMDDRELLGVIGHELGHIKAGHVLYKEMARWLQNLGLLGTNQVLSRSVVPGSPQAMAAGMAFQLVAQRLSTALAKWDQMSELTADRAAMLVVQEEKPCITMMMKLAGGPSRFGTQLDAEAFLDQARRLQDLTFQSEIADRHRRRMVAGATHPLLVERARILDDWIRGGGYAKVLAAPEAVEAGVYQQRWQPKPSRRAIRKGLRATEARRSVAPGEADGDPATEGRG